MCHSVRQCIVIAGQYVIRFTVTSQRTTSDDITRDWAEIKTTATDILAESQDSIATRKQRVKLAGAPYFHLFICFFDCKLLPTL